MGTVNSMSSTVRDAIVYRNELFYLTDEELQSFTRYKCIPLEEFVDILNSNKKITKEKIMRKISYSDVARWFELEGYCHFDTRNRGSAMIFPFGIKNGLTYSDSDEDLILNKRFQNIILFNLRHIQSFEFVFNTKYKEPLPNSPYCYVRFGDERHKKTTKHSGNKKRFHLEPSVFAKFPFSHRPLTLTEFSDMVNMYIDVNHVTRFSRINVNRWLKAKHYLFYVPKKNIYGKSDISISIEGRSIGLLQKSYPSDSRDIYLTAKAQYFILTHYTEIDRFAIRQNEIRAEERSLSLD